MKRLWKNERDNINNGAEGTPHFIIGILVPDTVVGDGCLDINVSLSRMTTRFAFGVHYIIYRVRIRKQRGRRQ